MGERIRFYVIGLLIAVSACVLATLSAKDVSIGLMLSIIIGMTLIFGNMIYYYKVEHLRDRSEVGFRIMKYILLMIIILILSITIFEA